jgi:hypothetical protein
MFEEKVTRVKQLLQMRDEIDAELATIFGLSQLPKPAEPEPKRLM